MNSDSSDFSPETDSSAEDGDDDLSHLGAAQTTVKSFTSRQETYHMVEQGSNREKLTDTILRSSPSAYGVVISSTGQQVAEEIRQLVPSNGTNNRTKSRMQEWTHGMVRTSALTRVMDKLTSGVTWVTIKGSPGDGKTTTAFMALEELHRSERQVFHVESPQEFSEVTVTCSKPVIMLDDILGNLEFDQTEWSKWKVVLHPVLGVKEHTSHKHETKMSKETDVTVLLVGRDYVLNSVSSDMGRISDYFTSAVHVVDMANTVERGIQEKLAIWKVISETSGIELDDETIDTICHINVPHGFPHVCRLFVTMRQHDPNIDAERFFKAPLEFLNQTVWKFMSDKNKLSLFKEMIKMNGKVSIRELEDEAKLADTIDAAESLVGTYLNKEDGNFTFNHPSIYDSVAFNICKRFTKYVIENCHLSFLHERIRLVLPHDTQPISEPELVVYIPRCYITDLAKRFAVEIANRNLMLVLSHKAFTDGLFIQELMSHITVPISQLLKLIDIESKDYFKYKETSKSFLSLVPSSKSPQLLNYIDTQTDIELSERDINTVLYGVCKYAASDVLTYLQQSRGILDINVRYEADKTPLMIASYTRDSQFILQVMSLGPDLNARDSLGATVLHYFCENGLKTIVEEVIDRGVNIDDKDWSGEFPLLWACAFNHVEVVRLLLYKGAKIDAETVVRTCRYGNLDIIKLLYERGATVNMTTFGDTPLTAASKGGHVKVMMFLFDKGASVNTATDWGWYPLHGACYWNKPQAVQWLLEHGAVIDIRDRMGNTPLHTTAERGSKDCVNVLLKAGSDVNVQNADGKTPLHTAAERGPKDCVNVLLKAGSDVNVLNTDGNTPLHTAAERGPKDCVNVLLKAGSDVNVQNADGNTPLHTAVERGSKDCVNVLLKAGADVNVQNTDGNTSLHTALDRGSKYFVDVFLKAGADVNVQNTHGNTPLHTAAERGSKDYINVLLNAGADVNVQNTDGSIPLHTAAGSGYKDCVNVLLKTVAAVDTKDRQEQTPLHKAVYYKGNRSCINLPDVSVCQTLINQGANVNKQDTEGNTPLHLLCQVDSHTEIDKDNSRQSASVYKDLYRSLVKLFVDHGADREIKNTTGTPALHGWCKTLIDCHETKQVDDKNVKQCKKKGKRGCILQ